jgi:hypothetical protein
MERHHILRIVLLLLASLFAKTAVTAQSSTLQLLLKSIDADNTPLVNDQEYPELRLELVPLNESGVPLFGLTDANVTLLDGNEPLPDVVVMPFVDVEQAVSVMVVLDMSAPMQPILEEVKTAVYTLYDLLEHTDESAVITFDSQTNGTAIDVNNLEQLDMSRELSFTNDEGALRNLIGPRPIESGAGTPLYDALFKAVRMTATQAANERRAVVVITNGADKVGGEGTTGSLIANDTFTIEEARQFELPIFTIGIGEQTDARFLQQAAILTGGEPIFVERADQVGQALAAIVFQLKQAYRVLATAVTPPDNAVHPLTLSVNASGLGIETISFQAYHPRTPQFTHVNLFLADGNINLAQVSSSGGTLMIVPEIVSRGEITAVNYFLDDQKEALFTATSAPWAFAWDTTTLPPNQAYLLTIEAVDAAQNAGYFAHSLVINACNWFCRLGIPRQMLPILAVVLLGLALLILIVMLIARARQAAPKTAVLPHQVPIQYQHHVYEERPFPIPTAPDAILPEPDTPLLFKTPNLVPRLVDEKTGKAYTLSYDLRIGQDAGTDITLSGADVADHHAIIKRENEQFVLVVNGRHNLPTTLNDTPVTERILLNDGDIIGIGQHHLRFLQ